VKPTRLDYIIELSGLKRIDLCIIDVEGHEFEVLQSFNFKIPVVFWLIEAFEEELIEKNTDYMETHNCMYIEKIAHNIVFINTYYINYFK